MDKPFSVIDEFENCYSQHGTKDKAQDSIYDLVGVFIGVPFEITEKLDWNEGGTKFQYDKMAVTL